MHDTANLLSVSIHTLNDDHTARHIVEVLHVRSHSIRVGSRIGAAMSEVIGDARLVPLDADGLDHCVEDPALFPSALHAALGCCGHSPRDVLFPARWMVAIGLAGIFVSTAWMGALLSVINMPFCSYRSLCSPRFHWDAA
jgi:hypothetical protein